VKILSGVAALVAGLAASMPAFATVATPVSEPGMTELLAAGAIAGLVVWVRNRRKK
jgi:hypothetical protein